MKILAGAKIVDGKLQVHIDIQDSELDLKGDLPGHPFRGNQWSGGQGSDGGGLSKYHDDKKFPPANIKGEDTQQRYKKSDGTYTEERQRLHEEIVDSLFAGKERPSGQPEFLVMGGGSASGKSSVIRSGQVKEPDGAVTVDSDALKGELPEYPAMVKSKESRAAAYTHEESSDVAKMAMKRSLDEGYNTVLDGTGDSSLEKLKSKTEAARAAGHRVRAVYLTVDTEEAIRRSDARAEKSGRKVPHESIRNIHASVSRIVPKAVESGLFDDFELWDNNGASPVKVASAKGKELVIHEQGMWDKFIAKGTQT